MLRLTVGRSVGQSLSLSVEPLLRGSWTDCSLRVECYCPSVLGSPRRQEWVCPFLWVTVFVGCLYLQEEVIIFFNPMAPFPKDHSFLDDYKVSSPYLSGNSNMYMRMGMNNWRNDNDGEKPKCSEKNVSQCHFVHYKSHREWPEIEPGLLRWNNPYYI